MYIKHLYMEIDKNNYFNIQARQGDSARYLLFTLLDNGVPFSLVGKTVRVYITKPDNTEVYNDATIINAENGQTQVQLTTQTLATAGIIKLGLKIYQGFETLSTADVEIIVSEGSTGESIESTNEFNSLVVALANAEGAKQVYVDGINNLEATYGPRLMVIENNYIKYIYPEEFTIPDEFKIDLFKFGKGYNTNFDIRCKKIKNNGKKYYVSTTGSDGNTGLSIAVPLKSIDAALAKSDIETLIVLEGDYWLTDNYTNQILASKSVNMIGIGKVRIIHGVKRTWTAHATYTNVYQSASGTIFGGAVALNMLDENGDEIRFTKVSTVEEVAITPFSYAKGTNIYINVPFIPDNTKVAILGDNTQAILITDATNNTQVKVYMENIQVFGGYEPVRMVTQTAQTLYNYIFAHKCKFSHAMRANGISVLGGMAYMSECIATKNYLDGFNYHWNTSAKLCYALEINCKGRNNGWVPTGTAGNDHNNGTTIHDGGKALRINGEYGNNQGGNIADISANTQAVILNCICYDSRTEVSDHNANFTAHSGAELWLEDSTSYGKSVNDLKVETNATIHAKNNQLLVGQNLIKGTLESA